MTRSDRDNADKELNPRQKLFCRNYAMGMTQAEAWLGAGYDCTQESAVTQAWSALQKVAIKAEVERCQDRMDKAIDRILLANAYKGAIKAGQLIDFSKPEVMASMSKDAMDRQKGKPKQQHEMSGQIEHIHSLGDVILQFGMDKMNRSSNKVEQTEDASNNSSKHPTERK